MAFDEGLADRIRRMLTGRVPFEEKRMFGGVAFMVADHMAVGIVKEELMVRFDPAEQDAVLARPHAREMDFTGRRMKGFAFVGPEGTERDPDLSGWIDTAVAYVRSLPPKAPKAEKKAKAPKGSRAASRKA